MPKPKSLADSIDAWNAAKAPEDLARIEELTTGAAVLFVRDDKIDRQETLDAAAFLADCGEVPPGGVVAASLRAPKAAAADPLTGMPLFKGKTITAPIVNWHALDSDALLLVAYAAETGAIPGKTGEQVVYELSLTATPPPWPRLRTELEALQRDAGKSARLALLLEQVRARLTVRPREVVKAPPPVPSPPAPPPCVGGPCRSMDCWWPTCGSATRSILVIHARTTAAGTAYQTFAEHAAGLRRQGVALHSIREIPPGVNTALTQAQMLASASLVALFLDASLLADDWDLLEQVRRQREETRVPVVPVLLSPCILSGLWFGPLSALPTHGFAKGDDKWCEVVSGLRDILNKGGN